MFADTGQGRNHGENLVATSAMVGRIFPHGGDRVKVSENFGATVVAPVVPVDTSLQVSLLYRRIEIGVKDKGCGLS